MKFYSDPQNKRRTMVRRLLRTGSTQTEIAQVLHTSEATVSRDIQWLKDRNLLNER